MAEQTSGLLWTEPAWLDEATAWIEAQLELLGRQSSGTIEQPHVRPWSTVLRVPTTGGLLYFKATTPALAHETALTAALTHWRSEGAPQVLAADLERSWMLMEDGGAPLRGIFQATGDMRHWDRILPLYAGIQKTTIAHVPELLALGIPDRRLSALPGEYARLLTDTEILRISDPEGLTSQEYGRLCDDIPRVAQMCVQLEACGIPETLQHDDLHDNNILVRDGSYTVFDWGDSCLSHPFFSLLVVMRSAARTQALESEDPAILRLRDVYLDAWTSYAPPNALQAAFALAYRLGMISRALTWYRLASEASGPVRKEFAGSVSGWLQEFLDAGAVLTTSGSSE